MSEPTKRDSKKGLGINCLPKAIEDLVVDESGAGCEEKERVLSPFPKIVQENTGEPRFSDSAPKRFRGCIVGLAVGDAIGAPFEFSRGHGASGKGADASRLLSRPAGCYTDDTQMSLATALGLIESQMTGESKHTVMYKKYREWLSSQDDPWQRRAPGNTCISALRSGIMGTRQKPINDSKGCGGVMRTAPVGLVAANPEEAFEDGADFAAITHGHPSGYLSAGFLSELIYYLSRGATISNSILKCRETLRRYEQHAEVLRKVDQATNLALSDNTPVHAAIHLIGDGWTGEEALGVALYCAVKYSRDWVGGVVAAINFAGDSDSTGSITGALLGTLLGEDAIPVFWRDTVEDYSYLMSTAVTLCVRFGDGTA